MYRGLYMKDNLLNRIVVEMKAEYLKAMNIDITEDNDLMIAYSDLTVWYYNRDRQSALSEIKRVWEQVSSNKLGTKSL